MQAFCVRNWLVFHEARLGKSSSVPKLQSISPGPKSIPSGPYTSSEPHPTQPTFPSVATVTSSRPHLSPARSRRPSPWRSPRSSRRRTWRPTPPRRRSSPSGSLSTVSSTRPPSHDPITDSVPLTRFCSRSAGAHEGGADAARPPPE
jgi:hypothetical protein